MTGATGPSREFSVATRAFIERELPPSSAGLSTITIYLTNELYDKVRDAPSRTVRAALEYYFENADASEKDSVQPRQSATKHSETEIVPKKK